MSWYILAIIPVLGLLVLVHEFGHFITAKWAGIRVEEFALGFPPALVSIRKRDRGGWEVMWFGRGRDADTAHTQNPLTGVSGGVSQRNTLRTTNSAGVIEASEIEGGTYESETHHTIYSLNLLPIGGFVRMPGESGDVLDENGNYDPGSFAAKSAGKRMIVLCAGVVMNLLLAMVLFAISYGVGNPIPSDDPVLGTITANSPASAADLRTGDRILSVSVDNQPAVAIKSFSQMHDVITNASAKVSKDQSTLPVTLEIQRNGEKLTKQIQARAHPGQNQGALGVSASVTLERTPIWQAPFKGIAQTVSAIRIFFTAIGQMITGALQPQFSGPVGIARITGETAQLTPTLGWAPILNLTALLSLNLAIFNILPFPALDGGRVVLILVELLRGGKRLKPEREGLINFVGIAVLLLLMVAVTVSDVIHWGG